MPEGDSVVLIAPSSIGWMHRGAAQGAYLWPTAGKYRVMPLEEKGKHLDSTMNKLWAGTLNGRAGVDICYCAMIDQNVEPENFWVDTLTDELERTGADLLSVVVPVTDERGITTTAVACAKDDCCVKQLTMKEIVELPVTFDITAVGKKPDDILLVDTKLWVCNFKKPWVEKFALEQSFQEKTVIFKDNQGRFGTKSTLIGWHLSRYIQAQGGKVMATRVVRAGLWGDWFYENNDGWGLWDKDLNAITPG